VQGEDLELVRGQAQALVGTAGQFEGRRQGDIHQTVFVVAARGDGEHARAEIAKRTFAPGVHDGKIAVDLLARSRVVELVARGRLEHQGLFADGGDGAGVDFRVQARIEQIAGDDAFRAQGRRQEGALFHPQSPARGRLALLDALDRVQGPTQPEHDAGPGHDLMRRAQAQADARLGNGTGTWGVEAGQGLA